MSDSVEAQRKAREAFWSKAAPELTLKSIHVDGGISGQGESTRTQSRKAFIYYREKERDTYINL